jgi:cytoskeletal protein CcmA (bactofilin family)
MTLVSKVLRYFKGESDGEDTKIAIYDSLRDDNYFQSFHSVILESNFRGTIVCLGDIQIKKNASFSGHLICRTCKIEGSFTGSLLSTEFTGVCKTAILDARIVTGSISIESNAVVKGIFNVTKNITSPEPMRKLEAIHKQSVPADDEPESTEMKKIITIILKGKPANAIPASSLPRPEIPPAEIKNDNTTVNTLTHPPETKMNRSEDNSATNTNAGWW